MTKSIKNSTQAKIDFKKLQEKWKKEWYESGIYKAKDFSKKTKHYVLVEFPYPSGAGLHMGHCRNYTMLDAYARLKRMMGLNVIYPMGWDAFGLPAFNFALKTGRAPQEVTKENIATFKDQLQSLGLSFDWSREFSTTDPQYYKWTQYIFLQLFNHWYDPDFTGGDGAKGAPRPIKELPIPKAVKDQGPKAVQEYQNQRRMAYRDKMPINWCPSCKTGLANEEVIDNGKCERCGAEVEQREIEQWLLRIRAYADRLVDDLSLVDFPESVKAAQENWIGRSRGAYAYFTLVDKNGKKIKADKLQVFTTRPDTLFGATFMVLAPEHAWALEITTKGQKAKVEEYIKAATKLDMTKREDLEREKTGVFTGVYAVNPVNKKRIPVWISDFVLGTYGSGAIMSVPAHDSRDLEFALKYDLPVIQVVKDNRYIGYIHKDWSIDFEALVKNISSLGAKFLEEKKDSILFEITEDKVAEFILIARQSVNEKSWHDLLGGDKYIAVFPGDKVYEVAKFEDSAEVKDLFELQQKLEPSIKDFKSLWQMLYASAPYRSYLCNSRAGQNMKSGFLDGLKTDRAILKMNEWLKEKKVGGAAVDYKLRNWIFSRQHYWGEPVPIVHCKKCGYVAVPKKDLPVELPILSDYKPTDEGDSPLAKAEEWLNTKCPECDGPAQRETDTMPNWAGSSWYFLRYCDPNNEQKLADYEKMNYWMPVDIYDGGQEHVTLHLLYSRFWHKFLYDLGLVPGREPYAKRRIHGYVLGEDGRKMSKSIGNIVNPDEIVKEYGADVVRTYVMFMGPYDGTLAWDTRSLNGVKRFVDRVWKFVSRHTKDWQQEAGETTGITDKKDNPGHNPSRVEELKKIDWALNSLNKKVADGITELRFNTAVAATMEFLNQFEKYNFTRKQLEYFVKLLAPFIPFSAEEFWHKLGQEYSVHQQHWPIYDPALDKQVEVEIAVQVNGKVRGKATLPAGSSKEKALELATKENNVSKYLKGKKIKDVVYVEDRLINILTEG